MTRLLLVNLHRGLRGLHFLHLQVLIVDGLAIGRSHAATLHIHSAVECFRLASFWSYRVIEVRPCSGVTSLCTTARANSLLQVCGAIEIDHFEICWFLALLI